jgi:hypothetical protein
MLQSLVIVVTAMITLRLSTLPITKYHISQVTPHHGYERACGGDSSGGCGGCATTVSTIH